MRALNIDLTYTRIGFVVGALILAAGITVNILQDAVLILFGVALTTGLVVQIVNVKKAKKPIK
ncbi:hypothetical protein NO559_00270 [Dasania sp. GY-MA-18]|uniref:Uncharacterized protein n=1 Tax=Dasania phycosphaerae TaxID=2950436 RepID=A0A9J6RHY5_9GAMM|nr:MULTISPECIES: hypothetical protein [Dasania]MCR8921185.1 hypothetical protein [Dasania sp. GY-MA-18]MCZ0863613.1 hypothetical protein [Dasania phycosphaerae]MCZ0867341.1 hypothetical protein [Dasania phycosphaerae]